MFKSSSRVPGWLSYAALMISGGIVSAADVPSAESVDRLSVSESIQQQVQKQHRNEKKLTKQSAGASMGESKAQRREKIQSMEQERSQVRSYPQKNLQSPGSGQKGKAMGGGRK